MSKLPRDCYEFVKLHLRMKTFVLLYFYFLLAGCKNNSNSNNPKYQKEIVNAINIFGSEIKKLPLDSTAHFDNSHIKYWLIKNYFEDKQIEIEIGKIFKNAKILKVTLKDDVANNIPTKYTLLNIQDKNEFYLLPINFIDVLQINNTIMISGIYSHREFEYYFIYQLDSNLVKHIFDSRTIHKNGIKIGYYRNDECIEYQPNTLEYSYDGNKSIFFSGNINYFCDNGFDRKLSIKVPIKQRKIKIRIDFIENKWIYNENSNYVFW